jgi:hypothetical protein
MGPSRVIGSRPRRRRIGQPATIARPHQAAHTAVPMQGVIARQIVSVASPRTHPQHRVIARRGVPGTRFTPEELRGVEHHGAPDRGSPSLAPAGDRDRSPHGDEALMREAATVEGRWKRPTNRRRGGEADRPASGRRSAARAGVHRGNRRRSPDLTERHPDGSDGECRCQADRQRSALGRIRSIGAPLRAACRGRRSARNSREASNITVHRPEVRIRSPRPVTVIVRRP